MATTSGNLMAGKAPASQGGNGSNGRYSLKAKLAAGAAILGCAATLAFGGLRASDGAQSPPRAGAPSLVATSAEERERNLLIAQNTLPESGAALDWEQRERGQVAPGFGACVYADALGVPGEGCGPAEADRATKLPDFWAISV